MTDDWSWLNGHRPPPEPETPPEEATLWALVKREHRVECRVRATPLGPELRVALDGELWWSQVVRPVTVETMTAIADQKRTEFKEKGWQVPGPDASAVPPHNTTGDDTPP